MSPATPSCQVELRTYRDVQGCLSRSTRVPRKGNVLRSFALPSGTLSVTQTPGAIRRGPKPASSGAPGTPGYRVASAAWMVGIASRESGPLPDLLVGIPSITTSTSRHRKHTNR
eukprot:725348-Rhodomonas_salina.1